jgi:hypothetical protein
VALLAELLEAALDLALDAKLLGSSLEEGKKLGKVRWRSISRAFANSIVRCQTP